MIMEFILSAVLLILSGLLLLLKGVPKPKNFPPGPKGWPIIGFIPKISSLENGKQVNLYESMWKLSDIFKSNVIGFFIGPNSQPFICVNGPEAVREALHNNDLNGRADTPFIRGRTFGLGIGIGWLNGELWTEQRRFALRHLRDLGFGRTASEDLIIEEILELEKEIKEEAAANPDGIVDFRNRFNLSNINILWAFIAGKRFQHDDARLHKLIDAVNLMFQNSNIYQRSFPIPDFVLKIVPFLKRYLGSDPEVFKPIIELIKESVNEHMDEGSEEPRDFIDVYLQEIRGQHEKSTFNKNQLIVNILDFFLAGSETTGLTTGWLFLYMMNYPEIQRKVQAELDQVCGSSLPLLEHRSSLPYTEAVLTEAQRMSSVAPFVAPHRAMKDTRLQGYSIPEGTMAFINIYSVHMDRKYWGDPEIFRPERHLNSDGKLSVHPDHFLPFGAGKRLCLGDSLARKTYYLFGASILKKFELKSIPGKSKPSLTPRYGGFTNGYQHFQAVVVPRP